MQTMRTLITYLQIRGGIHIIFFLFLHEYICCGYSLEMPRQGASNEYPQHMFLLRNKKDISIFQTKTAPYLLLHVCNQTVNVQADLSLHCAHISGSTFSHVAAPMFIMPLHTIVVGHDGFMLDMHPFLRQSYVRLYFVFG